MFRSDTYLQRCVKVTVALLASAARRELSLRLPARLGRWCGYEEEEGDDDFALRTDTYVDVLRGCEIMMMFVGCAAGRNECCRPARL